MKTLNKTEKRVIDWNEKFPVDRWWREKHKVPFMSPIHRESSFLDQLFEYYEDELINKYVNKEKESYVPNQGDFLKIDDVDKTAIINSMAEEFEKDFLNEGD